MVDATRRHIIGGGLSTIAVASASSKLAGAPRQNAGGSAATQLAQRAFATKLAPAFSAAAYRPEGPVWSSALGTADLELSVPATTSHRFLLGSVSKVITATAAARLASRKLVDLQAPISTWLADLPAQHRNTNLRQLLTHQGGIRHYRKEEIDAGSSKGAVYTRVFASDADVLALFINDPLVAQPGTSMNYSSYGYTLAAIALEVATGRKFSQLVEEEIAQPFALKSLVVDDPWAIIPLRAGKYMNAADINMLYASISEPSRPKLTNDFANMPFGNPAYCLAGAGLTMTPTDAARFGAAMISSPTSKISAPERTLLFTPLTAATSKSPPLGLGWRVDRDKKSRLRWHHAGATPGGCFFLAIYPEQGLSVALAGNVMNMRLQAPQFTSDLVDALA